MDLVEKIILILLSIPVGILLGYSTIYVFNRIPAKWLCDYGEEPDQSMWDERIKKKPWNIVFILVFIAAYLKLIEQGVVYAIPGILSIWLLLQIGISDKKYSIIPDQYVFALGVTALGFIPFQTNFLNPLYGAIIGGGSIFIIGVMGKLIFRKEAMGFGDVKLFAVIGLMFGPKATLIILFMTFFISAFIFGIGLIAKIIKPGDEQPLGPFIAGSTAAYILFHYEINILVNIYLQWV